MFQYFISYLGFITIGSEVVGSFGFETIGLALVFHPYFCFWVDIDRFGLPRWT
jgi:hypothetical protein